jgi:uncharacterized repeat protein (TIGR01451 family)
MWTWLYRSRQSARRPSDRRRRPAVEVLEGRCLPAQIAEFGAGITAGSGPHGITEGPDGNLWFTEFNNNAIARITPAGTVTEFSLAGFQAGSDPANITAGPGGLLYFTEEGVGRIGSINPLAGSDAAILASLKQSAGVGAGAGAGLFGITAGPDGNVWFTEQGASKVGSITPDLGTIRDTQTPTAGASPEGIVTGPDGALWFTENTADQIGRVTTAGIVTNEFQLPSGLPSDITDGPDGNLWFTAYSPPLEGGGTPSSAIGKVTTSGIPQTFPLSATADPSGITPGPDGNLWFTEYKDNQVRRISPAGVLFPNETSITPNSSPLGIVPGPDGNLWFTESSGNRIGRLTPDLTAIATEAFSGPVASFTDTNPGAAPGSFTVAIDWGDGTPLDTSTGTVAAVPGQPGHFTVSGTHTYASAGGDTIKVTIRDNGPTGGTFTATSPTTVVPFASSVFLAVQEFGPSRATAGGTLTYTVTVTNYGPSDAQNVVLTDLLPTGTTFLCAKQTAGPPFTLITPPVGGIGKVIADPPGLGPRQSAVFRIKVQSQITGPVINTVEVRTLTPNQNPNQAVSKPVAVPVQLTLSPAALADGSPAGTQVGILTVMPLVALHGQDLPPLYGLPADEADNASFVLGTIADHEVLLAQFQACYATGPSYQVSVHVDIGFGDASATLVIQIVAAGAGPCTPPPMLENVQAVHGGRQGRVRALVLQFSAPLDPDSAAGLGHYTIGLGSTGKEKRRKPVAVPLLGASYDPTRRAVTLRLGKLKGRRLRGTLTVQDVLGLNGVLANAAAAVDLRPKPSHKH